MTRFLHYSLLGLKILLGLLFVVSAVAKFLSIDQFEVYVYSFGFFSMSMAFILARLCIVGEFLLGIGLAANICNRLMNTAAALLLIFFTIFLAYVALIGRTDSCQCFGQLIPITPTSSIVKNALLLLLLLLCSRVPSFSWRPKWFVWLITALLPTIAIFILSPIDPWMFSDEDAPYNPQVFQDDVKKSYPVIATNVLQGHKIAAFVTPNCPFCRMSIDKLRTICHRYDLDSNAISFFVPQMFDTVSVNYHPSFINDTLFVRLTYGGRPLILLLDDGSPVSSFHYRNIDEQQIVDFLSDNQ